MKKKNCVESLPFPLSQLRSSYFVYSGSGVFAFAIWVFCVFHGSNTSPIHYRYRTISEQQRTRSFLGQSNKTIRMRTRTSGSCSGSLSLSVYSTRRGLNISSGRGAVRVPRKRYTMTGGTVCVPLTLAFHYLRVQMNTTLLRF